MCGNLCLATKEPDVVIKRATSGSQAIGSQPLIYSNAIRNGNKIARRTCPLFLIAKGRRWDSASDIQAEASKDFTFLFKYENSFKSFFVMLQNVYFKGCRKWKKVRKHFICLVTSYRLH